MPLQPLKRANIRLAATILLLRDVAGEGGLEVFMMQRPGGVDFPDLHVFPGGKVDDQDLLAGAEHYVGGCSEAEANRLLGLEAGGLRYWVTAIRECFEECGVLLARRDGKLLELTEDDEVARFDGYRQQLIDGELDLEALCREERLELAADQLLYFSHWLTPEMAPRRFDTRFFLARMPERQETAAHAWETAAATWVTPVSALAARSEGVWQMISPTIITLESVAGYADVASVLEAVVAERHLPVLTDTLREQGMMPLR